jgi:hypothetical protein
MVVRSMLRAAFGAKSVVKLEDACFMNKSKISKPIASQLADCLATVMYYSKRPIYLLSFSFREVFTSYWCS